MNAGEHYDESYFINGRATGKSLYTDYRWMPELTIPMVTHIARHCMFIESDTILDFGCARGYSVRALRSIGHQAFGVDISRWAIENADAEASPHLSLINGAWPLSHRFDWIIAKDVLEHIYFVQRTISDLMERADRGIFAVVPLSNFDRGLKYVIPEYDEDQTHCQRYTLGGWLRMFIRPGWSVEGSYRVAGIKDNWASKPEWAMGNGFITARKTVS